jgi:SAM-dependent methyltransferase/tetratricopeptide (TPR) repeat protein
VTLDQAVGLHQRGALREAAVAYVAFLRTHPDHADALRLLAMALLGLGHAQEALATLDRLPGKRNPVVAANRGQVLAALQRWDEAAEALQRAVRLDPALADAWAELARVEAARGRPTEACRAAGRALVAEPSRARAVAFADQVAGAVAPPADLREALLVAYTLDRVDHPLLDRAAEAALGAALDDPATLAADPLAHAWLQRGSVSHRVEHKVVALRAWLAAREATEEAVVAVALAAWAAEYAWRPDGRDGARGLGRAMFGDPCEGPLPAALQRCLRDEPAQEAALAAGIHVVALGDDHALQAMYEENPYPRRVGVQVREPVPFARWWAATFPHHPPAATPDVVDLLVAGCGTGRHALTSATTFRSRVTALDLSRASLARAQRRAGELGVPNVAFAQADLRALAGWDQRFDVIESVGVLHHLPDWVEGLRVLVGLLRPGGYVRFGLYAERARQDVVAARAFVAGHGFPDTPEGLREARLALAALPPDHPAHPVTRSVDFTSLSGCRDLVFHVREHRLDLPELSAGLRACGLRFLGFQHVLAALRAPYSARWPDDLLQDDLARWDIVEAHEPRTFAGMYVGWARVQEQA